MKSDWSTQLTYKSMALAMLAVFVLPFATATAQDKDTQNASAKKVRGPKTHRVSKTLGPAEGYKPVEMFAAMDAGDIKVELIPKDAKESSIFVTNNTDESLSVEMPEAFVGVSVLAQGFGGGGGLGGGGGGGNRGGGNRGGGQQGGGGQGIGGGVGGGQGGGGRGGGGRGGGGGGLGGGNFNIPPGKRARIKVATVCLEFHKDDPRPSLEYEIKPVDDYVKDQSVIEMLKMLANDEVTQPVAQAAAWHKMDSLSFEFLLSHNRKELSNGYFERFFTADQVYWGRELVTFAQARADAQPKTEEKKDDSETESRHQSREWGKGK